MSRGIRVFEGLSADFKGFARGLDHRALWEACLKCKQLLLTLEGKSQVLSGTTDELMWKDYQDALALLGLILCLEVRRRGGKSTMFSFFAVRIPKRDFSLPPELEIQGFVDQFA